MAHRVMVIEDNYDLLFLYETAFAQFGYEVSRAQSSDQAITLLKSDAQTPEVVILDIEMPGTPGTSVVDYIRSQSDLDHIKIIVVSANDNYRTKVQGRVSEYMLKPVGITNLIGRADALLDIKRE